MIKYPLCLRKILSYSDFTQHGNMATGNPGMNPMESPLYIYIYICPHHSTTILSPLYTYIMYIYISCVYITVSAMVNRW